MKLLATPLILALVSFTIGGPLATYKTNEAKSSLKIEGTSTLHDWEIAAKNFEGVINVDIYEDSIDIKDLRLSVAVKSLKSGKAPMDDNTHTALKADDHPKISYKFNRVKKLTVISEGKMNLVTEGQLTVAGRTRTMTIPLTALVTGNGIELKGRTSFKMTDFGVKPPSFMFGSVTTGDEVTILFDFKYN